MTEVSEQVEVADAAFYADPHAAYRRWRTRGGAQRVRFRDGTTAWVVSGYADARAALADPRLRKSLAGAVESLRRHGNDAPIAGQGLGAHMLNSDPPDHTRLRKLVNKAFTARAVEALRPRVEEITAGLLDDMSAHDEVDLMQAFAVPLPITVICELLGVPLDDRADFRGWTSTLLTSGGNPQAMGAAAGAMMQYLTALVQAKRERPADDLLSALVRARDDDDRLSEPELVSTAFLLLVAGHETTVNLIGNGVLALLTHPEQLAALRADLSRVPAAVEEFLRYDGPVNLATLRYTDEPVDIGGTQIPAGELVFVALPGANRDPERFGPADELDITREAVGHVAFGHGIHYCVGAPLARLEATIAFRRLLERFPGLSLAGEPGELAWVQSSRIRGLAGLPVLTGASYIS